MLTPEERLAHLEQRVAELEEKVPVTAILNRSFISRAFAVWGHYFVANLVMGIPFVVIWYFAFFKPLQR